MTMINVITFNILSPDLIKKEWYPDSEEITLDQDYRFEKIKEIFGSFIKDNYIFCLQEVSSKWAKKLGQYFSTIGYQMQYSPFVKGNSRL